MASVTCGIGNGRNNSKTRSASNCKAAPLLSDMSLCTADAPPADACDACSPEEASSGAALNTCAKAGTASTTASGASATRSADADADADAVKMQHCSI